MIMAPDKREYFCPTCRKIVADVRSEFGQLASPGIAVALIGELPVFVCRKCDAPVIELSRSKGKRKLITEKGIVEID